MPHNIDYYSKDTLTLHELRYLEDIIQEKYSTFDYPSADGRQCVHLKGLEKGKLLALEGIASLLDFSILCPLEYCGALWSEISSTIEEYQRCSEIRDYTTLFVDIGFEEKCSQQNINGHDSVSIKIERGQSFLYYSGNGSKISIDKEYAKSVFSSYIKALELPLKLVVYDGYFKLQALRGELKLIRSGLFGKNPSGFACDLFDLSPMDLASKLKEAIELMSNGKIFRCAWRLYPSNINGGVYENKLFELFNLIRQQSWLTSTYDVDFYISSAAIADFDSIRSGLGCSDEVLSNLIGFQMRDDLEVNVQVVTTKKGHRIMISLTACESPEDIVGELGNVLGLTFTGTD